ncbi:MAG: phosphoglycerate mutase family protein [Acidobacteriota bacterium]
MADETDTAPELRTRIRTIVVFSMLFAVFGAVVAFGYWTTFRRPVTTVIIVRHAEKNIEPNNPNPDLSPAGQARARELARILGNAGVTAIYATEFGRTQQTAGPLASSLGLQVTQVEAKNTAELGRQISLNNRGGVVFVAGHNNTVPKIIAELGGGAFPDIPETEFDNMFVLTVYQFGKAKVVKLKYGNPMAASGEGMMVK